MYAQYQTYQQPNQPMTSQGAMTWDSQRGGWIPSGGGAVASSTYSTYNSTSSYQQQQQQQQPSMNPSPYQQQPQQQQKQQIIPPNPVQTYTDYYHGWLAHGKECEEYLRRLVDQNQRSETQRRIDWAKYYADEASRAAHHFYSNPHATSAPFDLPPAPPQSNNNQQQQHQNVAIVSNQQQPAAPATQAPAAVVPQQQVNNKYQQQQKPTPPSYSTTTTATTTSSSSSSDENTPGGLTRYVKRCLDQCNTDQQRKAVQAEVEKVIAEAIQNGNLHTRNWESVPLIPVVPQQQQHISFSISPQHNNNNNRRLHNNNNNNSFFNNNRSGGNGGGGGKYSRRYDDKLPENDSYYGHHGGGGDSSNNNNNNNNGRPTSNKNLSPSGRRYDQQKLPQNDSYYGNSSGGGATTPNTNTNTNNDSRFGRQRSPPMNNDSRRKGNGGGGGQSDNYYGPASSSYSPNNNTNMASSYAEDSSSPLSSQKRSVVTPEEDFIAFQQQSRRNKKQKKSGKNGNGNGFEKSTHALAKRANRFSGPGGIYDANASSSSNVKNNGGHDQYMGKKLIGGSNKVLDEEDFQKMTVKGTCLKLEKEYLRLTAPPKAELVRPQPILERHLDNLKKDYAAKKRDYLWFCSQFKAMRQDCTVQRIQSGFTVDVYETHARIALQEGDLNEYNQCQTQLKELYESGYTMGNESEFIAYRLLYYCFLSTNEKYDGGSSDMFKILLQLTSEQKMDPAIAHALKTREALAFGDYIQFFRLHKDSPGLSRYLSDRIVPTMRMRGLRRMVKGYRPSLDVDVFKDQLGFDSMEGCTEFLTSCGCVIEGSNCITKDSNNIHEPVEEKKNSLI